VFSVPAARRKPLRAVKAEESAPAPVRRQSVAQAAASGDHRALLVAMRERIAQTVSDPDCPPRDLAALTRRLQDIAKEIEGIDVRAKEEGDDGGDVEDGAFDASAV
jgi:hypothetical protein